jgi:pimeloyl-ACP methyl ester carboxylesterase
MACIAFPHLARRHILSTSHTYSYAYHPPSTPFLPTLLFLHGFPSSCYDWRHQIQFFARQGYGVLAPDLLGYGGTSKPTDLNEYRSKKMAAEIIELLDHESIDKVHAVGHDTGCTLLSRLADYFPSRFLSCSFLDVPYSKPGQRFDLAMVNSMTKQFLGFERFGYIGFFVGDDAGRVLDQHVRLALYLFVTNVVCSNLCSLNHSSLYSTLKIPTFGSNTSAPQARWRTGLFKTRKPQQHHILAKL